jgi:hypothetical protein
MAVRDTSSIRIGNIEVLLGFEHLQGSHTRESLAEILVDIIMKYSITGHILTITTDNASNNSMTSKEYPTSIECWELLCKARPPPMSRHVIQLSLKELFQSIRVSPENDDVTTTWDESSIGSLRHDQGIALHFGKGKTTDFHFHYSSDYPSDPIAENY